jgi:DNA-binding transcriptional MerR regulator
LSPFQEEKQKIDEQIKEADATLQSKDVTIEAINEHLQLNEKLKEHGLSTQDIDKLLNLLSSSTMYGLRSHMSRAAVATSICAPNF